ncbi:MAG: trigger factor [Polyangiaceae bacterium]
MQISANQLSPVILELNVEVDADRVRAELEKAYVELGKQAQVRGFRRGKAPRNVLRHVFGPRVAADVARRLVDETYPKALSEQNVQTVSQPAIESNAPLAENQPFSYKARVEVLPKIASVTYTGFQVKRPSVTVSDERVNERLEELRLAHSTLEPVGEDHLAQAGDVVTADIQVRVNGQVVEDAQATDMDLELGRTAILPEIEQAILGHKPPHSADAEVDVPAGHPHPRLRGKTAVFSVTLKDIKTRVLPQLDDEFAKDLGEFSDLGGLRQAVVDDLKKGLDEAADNVVAQALVAELVKSNPIEVPPSLVQRQMEVTRDEIVRAQRRNEQLPNDLQQRIALDSEVKVRAGLLMAEIAKAQNLKVGDEEIEEGLKTLAEQSGKNIAKLRVEYRERSKRELLVGMILENKVLDIIEAQAQIEQE